MRLARPEFSQEIVSCMSWWSLIGPWWCQCLVRPKTWTGCSNGGLLITCSLKHPEALYTSFWSEKLTKKNVHWCVRVHVWLLMCDRAWLFSFMATLHIFPVYISIVERWASRGVGSHQVHFLVLSRDWSLDAIIIANLPARWAPLLAQPLLCCEIIIFFSLINQYLFVGDSKDWEHAYQGDYITTIAG